MGNGVILDTNCFSHVFSRSDKRHGEYASFLEWLTSGPGYLVYGGTKYFDELKKSSGYLRLFSLLRQYNKAIVYDCRQIDLEMERIVAQFNTPKFNDPHLAAIVIVSKSMVICTGDEKCIPFLKMKEIYEGRAKIPKFYTGDRCNNLLSKRYVGKQASLPKKSLNAMMAAMNGLVS